VVVGLAKFGNGAAYQAGGGGDIVAGGRCCIGLLLSGCVRVVFLPGAGQDMVWLGVPVVSGCCEWLLWLEFWALDL
jgi:hypothetical protein